MTSLADEIRAIAEALDSLRDRCTAASVDDAVIEHLFTAAVAAWDAHSEIGDDDD